MDGSTLRNQVRLCAEAVSIEKIISEKQVHYAFEDKKHDAALISERLGYLAAIQYAEKSLQGFRDADYSGQNISLSVLFNHAGGKSAAGLCSVPNDPAFFPVVHQLAAMDLGSRIALPLEQKSIFAFALNAYGAAEKDAVFTGVRKALDFVKGLDIEMLEASDFICNGSQPGPDREWQGAPPPHL